MASPLLARTGLTPSWPGWAIPRFRARDTTFGPLSSIWLTMPRTCSPGIAGMAAFRGAAPAGLPPRNGGSIRCFFSSLRGGSPRRMHYPARYLQGWRRCVQLVPPRPSSSRCWALRARIAFSAPISSSHLMVLRNAFKRPSCTQAIRKHGRGFAPAGQLRFHLPRKRQQPSSFRRPAPWRRVRHQSRAVLAPETMSRFVY